MKPTSFSISKAEREEQLLDEFLALTKKGMSEYVRELIRRDQPNRLREMRERQELQQQAAAVTKAYKKPRRTRRETTI